MTKHDCSLTAAQLRFDIRGILYAACLFCALMATGCGERAGNNQLYQTSTLNALQEGVFEGNLSLGELKRHGDFGIGTLNRLDGEMIGLDGEFYQVKADGQVVRVADLSRTPFACVTFFEADDAFRIDRPVTMSEITRIIDARVPSENLFYAIRVEGDFRTLKARSVPAQERPFPRLLEVAKRQSEFSLSASKGTLAGFRCPPYVSGINIEGYHLHYLSDNRHEGGHVLDFLLDRAVVKIDRLDSFRLALNDTPDFYKTDISQDKTAELASIE